MIRNALVYPLTAEVFLPVSLCPVFLVSWFTSNLNDSSSNNHMGIGKSRVKNCYRNNEDVCYDPIFFSMLRIFRLWVYNNPPISHLLCVFDYGIILGRTPILSKLADHDHCKTPQTRTYFSPKQADCVLMNMVLFLHQGLGTCNFHYC